MQPASGFGQTRFFLLIGPVEAATVTTNIPSGQLAASQKNAFVCAATVCLYFFLCAHPCIVCISLCPGVSMFGSVCVYVHVGVCLLVICLFAPSHLCASVHLFCLVVHAAPTRSPLPRCISPHRLPISQGKNHPGNSFPSVLLLLLLSCPPHICNSVLSLSSVSSTNSLLNRIFGSLLTVISLYLCFGVQRSRGTLML